MNKKFCLIVIFILNFCNFSFAQNISEKEMRLFAKELTTIQIRNWEFNILNSGLDNGPDNYIFNKYNVEFLKICINSGVDMDDVIKYKELKKYNSKFKVFKIAYFRMRTWFIIAFGNDGSHYLLRNFEYNHFNNLIRQKIGRPKRINEYLDIGSLYINTVQFSDYGFKKVINTSDYNRMKNKFTNIRLPKLYNYKGDTIFEFYSYQDYQIKIKFHKMIFSNGLVKKVEETLDDR